MAKEIKTEILINAIPEKVWSIFTNFDNYPNWNPFNSFHWSSTNNLLTSASVIKSFFSVAGEFINNDLVEELELLNNFYKFIVPNVLYLASRYIAKNRKIKPRQLFSKESSFMEDTLLPLIVNFKSFNDFFLKFYACPRTSTLGYPTKVQLYSDYPS